MGYNISCCTVEKIPVLAQAAAPTAKTEEDSREGKESKAVREQATIVVCV